MSPQARAAIGVKDELVRISVALEHVEMLISETTSALDKAGDTN